MAMSTEERRLRERDQKREWRKTNREVDRARAKAYYHQNRQACRARQAEYRLEHRDKLNAYCIKWSATQQGRAKKLVRAAAARARKGKLAYALDWQWLVHKLAAGVCEATGLPLVIQRGISPFAPSLDRINPALGYTKENTRVVIYVFNMAKSQFTDSDVERMCVAFLSKRHGNGTTRKHRRHGDNLAPAAGATDGGRALQFR